MATDPKLVPHSTTDARPPNTSRTAQSRCPRTGRSPGRCRRLSVRRSRSPGCRLEREVSRWGGLAFYIYLELERWGWDGLKKLAFGVLFLAI
jgi:hypothetical protein